ncbi:hypothetical protein [Streptomyces sp. NBC_00154]|uniref:hypothetical protein n=1 Tax=Streptomyces sp. NBC_00154 TaxID=2975670 RepID=UPI00224E542A|nr:hypothetical protein [Streptomyces sp. NBC_00154]MCX5311632.1 immunity 49 family protein [Streptomyces sp. NBC_00154]
MSTNVTRHEFPIEGMAEAMAARIQSVSQVLDRLETSETSRSRALSSMLTVVKSYCLADPTAQKFPTWEAWVTAMQVGSALFAAGTAAEGPVPCRIGPTAR